MSFHSQDSWGLACRRPSISGGALMVSEDRLGRSCLLRRLAETQHWLAEDPHRDSAPARRSWLGLTHLDSWQPRAVSLMYTVSSCFSGPGPDALNKPAHLAQVQEVEPSTSRSWSLHLSGEEVGAWQLTQNNHLKSKHQNLRLRLVVPEPRAQQHLVGE